MLKAFLIVLISINTFAFSISSDDDYKIFENKNYSIVYTPTHKNEAIFIKNNLDRFILLNDTSFAYSFDEPLKIVLISNNIQIANAFSTQRPFNMGVYWNGGSSKNDYFASNSWLTTLFIHEMIHNYQINAKQSKISKTLHKYLGNNIMPVFAILPFFTIPNYLLPTAILEGNAVLNESIYSNGGRLHNGSLNALKNTIIFSNKLSPSRFINDHLDFPYTNEKYIVGGFYMKYMMEMYGLDKINSLFYQHSIHSINPLLLKETYKKHFNVSFEQSIHNFIKYTQNTYSNYKEEKVINLFGVSKQSVYLSKIEDKIYFITSDAKTKKILNTYNTRTNTLTKNTTSLSNNKIFKQNNTLYTANSSFINKNEYKYGLFDEDNYILESSKGKAIQSIYKDKIANINIKESFLNSKLYINDKFYSKVSSASLFDKNGNIYYFKQEDEKRTLYKNKNKLITIDGYFSKIVDIVNNEVFFIANTKNGSTLYKYANNKIFNLSKSDNIINAKIINKEFALVVSVQSDSYKIHKIPLANNIDTVYYEKGLANIQKMQFKQTFNDTNITNTNYQEFLELEFSYLYPSFQYDSVNGNSYNIYANFTDPLMFNEIKTYAIKENNDSQAGISYINTRRIPFTITAYDMNRNHKYRNERGYGASIKIFDTLYQKGRHIINTSVKLFYDDEDKNKKPLIFTLAHKYSKNFNLEDSPYLSSNLKMLIKHDNSNQTFVLDYKINKHITNELYFNAQSKIIYNNSNKYEVKVVNSNIETSQDATKQYIQGINNDFYVKDLSKLSFGFSKSFHISKYFSRFPFSLRKESIFYNYNYYKINSHYQEDIKENIIGIKFDILLIHKIPIPVVLKYIKSNGLEETSKVTFGLGMNF